MDIERRQSRPIKLSICITTRNRASLIGRTLESILQQMTEECEVVVLDAASSDNTEECVRGYARQSPSLRYYRADANNGIDADYDRTVELACGEYCWLAADDDLFRPHAISTMIMTLKEGYSLVVANAGAVAATTSQALEQTRFKFAANRVYGPDELDSLFVDTASALAYIGCVVINRSLWLARERRRYYGSFFIHIGVIFQERLPHGAKAVVMPFIDVTQGNERSFALRMCEICYSRLPRVVESLALSPAVKAQWLKPWRMTSFLLVLRACGLYSVQEYRRWVLPNSSSRCERVIPAVVALLPTALVNAVTVAYYSVCRPSSTALVWLKNRRI